MQQPSVDICTKCNRICNEVGYVALKDGACYHKACFTCTLCRRELPLKFALKNGLYYHVDCYTKVKTSSPGCARCGLPVLTTETTNFQVGDQLFFHGACFNCDSCYGRLDAYSLWLRGMFYHQQCIACVRCNQPLADQYEQTAEGDYRCLVCPTGTPTRGSATHSPYMSPNVTIPVAPALYPAYSQQQIAATPAQQTPTLQLYRNNVTQPYQPSPLQQQMPVYDAGSAAAAAQQYYGGGNGGSNGNTMPHYPVAPSRQTVPLPSSPTHQMPPYGQQRPSQSRGSGRVTPPQPHGSSSNDYFGQGVPSSRGSSVNVTRQPGQPPSPPFYQQQQQAPPPQQQQQQQPYYEDEYGAADPAAAGAAVPDYSAPPSFRPTPSASGEHFSQHNSHYNLQQQQQHAQAQPYGQAQYGQQQQQQYADDVQDQQVPQQPQQYVQQPAPPPRSQRNASMASMPRTQSNIAAAQQSSSGRSTPDPAGRGSAATSRSSIDNGQSNARPPARRPSAGGPAIVSPAPRSSSAAINNFAHPAPMPKSRSAVAIRRGADYNSSSNGGGYNDGPAADDTDPIQEDDGADDGQDGQDGGSGDVNSGYDEAGAGGSPDDTGYETGRATSEDHGYAPYVDSKAGRGIGRAVTPQLGHSGSVSPVHTPPVSRTPMAGSQGHLDRTVSANGIVGMAGGGSGSNGLDEALGPASLQGLLRKKEHSGGNMVALAHANSIKQGSQERLAQKLGSMRLPPAST